MRYSEVRFKVKVPTYERFTKISQAMDTPISKMAKNALMEYVVRQEMLLSATKLQRVLGKAVKGAKIDNDDIYGIFDDVD